MTTYLSICRSLLTYISTLLALLEMAFRVVIYADGRCSLQSETIVASRANICSAAPRSLSFGTQTRSGSFTFVRADATRRQGEEGLYQGLKSMVSTSSNSEDSAPTLLSNRSPFGAPNLGRRRRNLNFPPQGRDGHFRREASSPLLVHLMLWGWLAGECILFTKPLIKIHLFPSAAQQKTRP